MATANFDISRSDTFLTRVNSVTTSEPFKLTTSKELARIAWASDVTFVTWRRAFSTRLSDEEHEDADDLAAALESLNDGRPSISYEEARRRLGLDEAE